MAPVQLVLSFEGSAADTANILEAVMAAARKPLNVEFKSFDLEQFAELAPLLKQECPKTSFRFASQEGDAALAANARRNLTASPPTPKTVTPPTVTRPAGISKPKPASSRAKKAMERVPVGQASISDYLPGPTQAGASRPSVAAESDILSHSLPRSSRRADDLRELRARTEAELLALERERVFPGSPS